MTAPSTARTNSPGLWGHRGLGGTPYENTLTGFEQALAQGATGIELDVRRCATGQLVVMHDRDLLRMAGSSRRVAELSFETLRAIPLAQSGELIPSLSEAIDLVRRQGAELNIELKTDSTDVGAAIDALVTTLAAHSPAEQAGLIVSSFGRRALYALQDRGLPRLALLVDKAIDPATIPAWACAIHPRASLVSQASLSQWRARGLRVNPWTVNDADTARRLARVGVDAIITDDVPALRAALEG